MKSVFFVLLFSFCLVKADEEIPPPLEVFFTEPQWFNPSPGPEAGWVAFLGPDESGLRHLWVIREDQADTPIRMSLREAGNVTAFFWLEDGRLAWETAEKDGRPRFFTGSPGNDPPQEIPVSCGRNVSLMGVSPARNDPAFLLGISEKNTAFPDLYRLTINGNCKPVKILANTRRVFSWTFDRAGNPVAGLRWNEDGSKEILAAEGGNDRVWFRAGSGDDLRLLSADERNLWIITNKDSELTRLGRIDRETGEFHPVFSDPKNRVDAEGVVMDASAGKPHAVSYPDESIRWQTRDAGFRTVLEETARSTDGWEVLSASRSAGGESWVVSCRPPGQPPSVCADPVAGFSASCGTSFPRSPPCRSANKNRFRIRRGTARGFRVSSRFPGREKPPGRWSCFPTAGRTCGLTPGMTGGCSFSPAVATRCSSRISGDRAATGNPS